jgi:peptidoglycan-associated lipoprotein
MENIDNRWEVMSYCSVSHSVNKSLKGEIAMQKRTIVSLTLALFCASLLITGSCTKKEFRMEEGRPATGAPPEAAGQREPSKIEMSALEEEKRAEAERRAMTREQERTQMLQQEIQAFESAPIYFDFDKSTLKPPARENLTKKAKWLRANPRFSIQIEGHCDEQGANHYNLALGERRASATAKFLTGLGISESRVSTISYGEERPAVPGHDEEAWAKNRRAEFRVIQK